MKEKYQIGLWSDKLMQRDWDYCVRLSELPPDSNILKIITWSPMDINDPSMRKPHLKVGRAPLRWDKRMTDIHGKHWLDKLQDKDVHPTA